MAVRRRPFGLGHHVMTISIQQTGMKVKPAAGVIRKRLAHKGDVMAMVTRHNTGDPFQHNGFIRRPERVITVH